jgi:hypothetical protein
LLVLVLLPDVCSCSMSRRCSLMLPLWLLLPLAPTTLLLLLLLLATVSLL